MLNDKWKQRVQHWAKELFFMAIIIVIVSNTVSLLRSPDIKDKNLPDIATILTNEELFSTQDFADRPVLIHFWATWCPTCKIEAANIQEISDSYNVLTIAVKSGSDKEINTFLKDNDLDYNVINDAQGVLAQDFSVQAYPTTFIYNKDNKLSFTEVGYTSTWGLKLRMWWAGL